MSSPLHILIVEDSRLQAKRLMKFLKDQGYEVAHAGDGQRGLEAARSRNPDLIITDVIMPVMDGFEMCRSIRENTDLYLTPIVMVTSLSNPEDVLRGLEAGADCYITKPYEGKIMLSRIRSVLALPRIPRNGETDGKLQLVMGGKRYVITAGRQQILSLLLSTYEDAVLQNMKLRDMRAKLVGLNETLERRVAERTSALREEISQRKVIQAEREKLIEELTAARDALQFKATHDDLTSQWNRATILKRLELELIRLGSRGDSAGCRNPRHRPLQRSERFLRAFGRRRGPSLRGEENCHGNTTVRLGWTLRWRRVPGGPSRMPKETRHCKWPKD